jgi:hypothetical protein
VGQRFGAAAGLLPDALQPKIWPQLSTVRTDSPTASRTASEDLIPRGPLPGYRESRDGNSSASGAKIAATNSGVAAEVLLPDRHLTIVSRRRAATRM